MKILFIIGTLGGGGAEKLLRDILPLFNTYHNIECELLVISDKDDKYSKQLISQGVSCTFLPKIIKGHIAKIQYINNFIKKGGYNIVHAHLFPALYYCSVIKRFKYKDVSFIFTEHNTDNRRRHIVWLRSLEKWIYKPYDCIISISNQTRIELLKWIKPKDKKKYITINNGVPIDQFISAMPYERSKIDTKLTKRDILLCMIGSFTQQKNHIFMIDVMKQLTAEYKIILLGEGVLENEIKAYVHNSGLEDRVIFMGFRRDVAEIIKTSDIIVIPSLWEGFGLIAVEALACGKQVVCSDVPGLSEVVGSAGIKVKAGDTDGFLKAIKSATGNISNKDIESKCKEQAGKFDINIMIKESLDIYKLLAKTKNMKKAENKK